MSSSVNLQKYLPHYYKDVPEFNAFLDVENETMGEAKEALQIWLEDQFISTAHLEAIKEWEIILDIRANPSTETLEFRRERIINRLSTIPPFSMPFLRKKLDEIVGVGKWNAYLDFNNYTLYIEYMSDSYEWYNELMVTITAIKPCNITFVSKPTIIDDVLVSEEVVKIPVEYYYKLGIWQLGVKPFSNLVFNYKLGKWELGRLPFMSYPDEEVVKLATTPSIKDEMLNGMADSVAARIDHVVLNRSVTIPKERLDISSTDGAVRVGYNLYPSDDIDILTYYSVEDADGDVLSAAVVAVPITDTVIMQHRIRIEEGVNECQNMSAKQIGSYMRL